MKLSVIITCYNFEAVIVRCIDSVVKQLDDANFADVEVIVVDDVSKDASVSVISDYIARFSDRNIRLVCREQNGGVCAAKNTGLSVAKGEYLWILDGDDYISDRSLAVVLKAISDYPDEEIITFDARFHYPDELVVEKRDMPVSKSISGIDFFKKNYVVCLWRNIISASYQNYPFQKRTYGFMGEILLPLYCQHNGLKIKHLPVLMLDDGQNMSPFKILLNKWRSNFIFKLGQPLNHSFPDLDADFDDNCRRDGYNI